MGHEVHGPWLGGGGIGKLLRSFGVIPVQGRGRGGGCKREASYSIGSLPSDSPPANARG
ncbi:hypothetical protein E2562_031661, partial [Oryza meyeriana var. granulata]